jgi:hypothetical protein
VDRGYPIAAEPLAATEDAAAIVRRVTAFPDRLGIEDARLSVQLPDGREQPMRELRRGPTAEYYDGEFTIREPVHGAITFILNWPSRGIVNARTSLSVASS